MIVFIFFKNIRGYELDLGLKNVDSNPNSYPEITYIDSIQSLES